MPQTQIDINDYSGNETPLYVEMFTSVEELMRWFSQAWQARVEGARVTGGISQTPRPCEPLDVMVVLSRLSQKGDLNDEDIKLINRLAQRGFYLGTCEGRRPLRERDRDRWYHISQRLIPVFRAKGILA